MKYLLKLAPKVQKLKVDFFRELSADNEKLLDKIDLSRLLVLEMRLVCEEITSKLLSRCNSLHTLDLFEQSPVSDALTLRSFLERNKGLVSLLLGWDYCTVVFMEDISKKLPGARKRELVKIYDTRSS